MVDFAIGSDHRGYQLKEKILKWLCPVDGDIKFNITVVQDVGINKPKRIDYNDIATKVAELMDEYDKAILICGSGFGMCVQANRYSKVRAVVCNTIKDVKQARQHNNMNVLCIGADVVNFSKSKMLIKKFFETDFLKGRHTKRVKKLGQLRNV